MNPTTTTRSASAPAPTKPKSRFHYWFGDLKIADGYTDFVRWGRGGAEVTKLYDQFGRVVYAPKFVRRLIRDGDDQVLLAAAAAALEEAGPRGVEKRIPEAVDFHASRERAFPLLDELVQVPVEWGNDEVIGVDFLRTIGDEDVTRERVFIKRDEVTDGNKISLGRYWSAVDKLHPSYQGLHPPKYRTVTVKLKSELVAAPGRLFV